MSSCDQLQALMTKNFILMKRNCCATLCEIFFPIILMILLALVKSIFSTTDIGITESDREYLLSNSSAYPSLNNISGVFQKNSSINISNMSFYGLPVKTGQL